ncbi:MAG: CoA transferase [Alcaligenaceae bacterium]|nr:CoA transferase [Alcaligenaceae bacterium]
MRVVDLSRVLAGPLCTQMLADHGADVIKIEPPFGDETRPLGPPFDAQGKSAYFNAINRGKRTLALNLNTPEDQQVVLQLLEEADVLVENFLPGTMEKWGLGYEQTLARHFPRLVYCSITGFGDDGPCGGQPGYDAVLQAMCGLMSINGSPHTGPTRIGIPIVDHLTAYTAMNGIIMALLHRQRSGQGQYIEATLYDTALSLLVPHASNWMLSGKTPQLLGSAHPNIAPYDSFQASDGAVFLGILNDAQFARFSRSMGHPELADDPRVASNAKRLEHRDALRTEIEALFARREKIELCQQLMNEGIPAGPINTVPEALEHAHTRHRNMWVQRPGYQGLGLPIRLRASPGKPGSNPPGFDQHAYLKEHLPSPEATIRKD